MDNPDHAWLRDASHVPNFVKAMDNVRVIVEAAEAKVEAERYLLFGMELSDVDAPQFVLKCLYVLLES